MNLASESCGTVGCQICNLNIFFLDNDIRMRQTPQFRNIMNGNSIHGPLDRMEMTFNILFLIKNNQREGGSNISNVLNLLRGEYVF